MLSSFIIVISHCLLTLSQNLKPSNIVIWLNRSGDSKKNHHPARETVTETVFSTEVRSVRHQRTPPSFKGNLTSNLSHLEKLISLLLHQLLSKFPLACNYTVK